MSRQIFYFKKYLLTETKKNKTIFQIHVKTEDIHFWIPYHSELTNLYIIDSIKLWNIPCCNSRHFNQSKNLNLSFPNDHYIMDINIVIVAKQFFDLSIVIMDFLLLRQDLTPKTNTHWRHGWHHTSFPCQLWRHKGFKWWLNPVYFDVYVNFPNGCFMFE